MSRRAPAKIAVPESGVVVAGPPGFCVDQSSSRVGGDGGAFVLLGSCASISGSAGAPRPDVPAVLTVSVSQDETDGSIVRRELPALAQFFKTPEGQATLARSGNPRDIELIETWIQDGALFLHARDSSGASQGMAPDYWRALFALNGRLLSVSVLGFEGAPVPDTQGISTLDDFADRIRRETARGAG